MHTVDTANVSSISLFSNVANINSSSSVNCDNLKNEIQKLQDELDTSHVQNRSCQIMCQSLLMHQNRSVRLITFIMKNVMN